MFKGDGVLNLVKFGPDPRVVDITVCVKFCKRLETFIGAAVVDEPTRGLGEEKNESSKDHTGNTLDPQTGTPLAVVGRSETDVGTYKALRGGNGEDVMITYRMKSRRQTGNRYQA